MMRIQSLLVAMMSPSQLPLATQQVLHTGTHPRQLITLGDVNVTGSATPGDEFPVGTSSIAYLAVDASNNQATCAVNIIVRGKTHFDFVFVSYKRQFTESTCNNVMKLFTSAM